MTRMAIEGGQDSEFKLLNGSVNWANQTNSTGHVVNFFYAIPVGITLCAVMIATMVGNGLVIAAVIRERQLHSLTNRLIASLAVTDLLVGVLVMPFAAIFLIEGSWPFASALCDVYVTLDVMCCTSSILHLVAIAVDRYWTVTDVSYTRTKNRHKNAFICMLTIVWIISGAVSLPPFFGWRTERAPHTCEISQDKGYTVYSTVGAFYLPLSVIVVIYIRIFLVVRSRVRMKPFQNHNAVVPKVKHSMVELGYELTPPFTQETSKSLIIDNFTVNEGVSTEISHSDETSELVAIHKTKNLEVLPIPPTNSLSITPSRRESLKTPHARTYNLAEKVKRSLRRRKVDKLSQKRERKAIRTLLIITGIFICCWLPFFLLALMCPFTAQTCGAIPASVRDFFTWLGYSNSVLNPIIYTIFSPDFRAAFRKILTGYSLYTVGLCNYEVRHKYGQ